METGPETIEALGDNGGKTGDNGGETGDNGDTWRQWRHSETMEMRQEMIY